MKLAAARGLALVFEDGATMGRLEWGEPDWFGPVSQQGRDAPLAFEEFTGADDLGRYQGLRSPGPIQVSVRAYASEPLLVFRLEALEALEGLATGSFETPSIVWPWLRPDLRMERGVAEGSTAFGYSYTEFALPSFSDASLSRFFILDQPARPAVVEPLLLIAPDGRSLMLAPLDSFHEQVIAVPRGREGRSEDGVRCGWHGDLERVPAGFASELGVFAGDDPRELLERWGSLLRERNATRRPSRYVDDAVGRLSYWTDNGAAYWYRTEAGRDMTRTLGETLEDLRRANVPVHAVELDSWWYPHHKTRPVAPGPEAPNEVPPTGALRWEARDDVLPEGVSGLRRAIGSPPLILHGRHFSSASPYFEDDACDAWFDGDRAHPSDARLFDRLMAQAASWGAIQYEQDWLVESFLGVRGLRAEPRRARDWQEGLDRAAAEHGLSLLWCMATPADFMQTTSLERVAAIRTSGDYSYRIPPALNWAWFLLGNAFARALGLPAFKDVFLSSADDDGWNGDPHAELEALLAALSAGPVGIGDRLGRTDRDIVMRTCRDDGVLVKPDVPLAALGRCMRQHPFLNAEPLLAETYSDHPAGRWRYALALHASRTDDTLGFEITPRELGCTDAVVVYDWRSGSFARHAPDEPLRGSLAPGKWALRVLCPLLPGEIAVFGDVFRYASVGDRRLEVRLGRQGGVDLEVRGAPGESVDLRGWSASPLAGTARAADGRWRADVEIGDRGWTLLRLRPS